MNFRKTAAVLLAALMSAIMIAGCGKINASDTAVTINGEAISAGTASTYVRYQQASTYTMMKNYGLITEGSQYWDMDMPSYDTETASDSSSSSTSSEAAEAKTYGDAFLEDVHDSLVTMALIRQHAGDYGFSLSDDQQKAITEAAAKFISDNGSVAKWIGADQASVENLLSMIAHQTLLYDDIIADTDREVSDEEAAQSTIIYARLSLTPSEDYEGTDEEYAEEVKKAVEELIPQMNTEEAVQTEETEDAETEEVSDVDKISEVAKGINESFYVTTTSYGNDDTALDDAVKEAANTLADGEVYDSVIETDTYLYAVKMVSVFDEEATESKKTSIISERESQLYTDTIASWKDASEITDGKAWTELKVTDKESYVTAEK